MRERAKIEKEEKNYICNVCNIEQTQKIYEN
jgi:hypothetical protein